jgi:hypothetical protein
MEEEMTKSPSDKHVELMNAAKDSGVIDFTQRGAMVTQITPQLFDPAVVADNYIATGHTDVVQVWKTGRRTSWTRPTVSSRSRSSGRSVADRRCG